MSFSQDNNDKLVLDSFTEFVLDSKLIKKEELETTIDEVIGSYIVNTIKQFYEEYEKHKIWLDDLRAQDFDVDNFIEIIDAYLNGFNMLEKNSIIKWLISLKKEIDELNSKNCSTVVEKIQEILPENQQEMVVLQPQTEQDPNIKLLTEIFPDISLNEINKAYKKSNKDYNQAIEELLIIQNLLIKDEIVLDRECLNEQEKLLLKEKTVKKFGLVEVNEDGTPIEVKPVFSWNSEKKLVRYYDSKVVTTKGDKYFELKTEQDEEMDKKMKKTYINLKPARKYRFH